MDTHLAISYAYLRQTFNESNLVQVNDTPTNDYTGQETNIIYAVSNHSFGQQCSRSILKKYGMTLQAMWVLKTHHLYLLELTGKSTAY
ncbi:uncharacterized protein Dmoj_GI25691 [Drosophila mojavensis]|uniref:Uncharacterized protein n=1 Tax=Drosophila mojavensis TaxID=7230 RepID=A0A0Q9XIC8_DROMO|nr:uncharacterized protein Dmoj_GI25691 [Drosophila mojavensis]